MPTITFEPEYKPNPNADKLTPQDAKDIGANTLAGAVRLATVINKIQVQGGINYFKKVRGPEPEYQEKPFGRIGVIDYTTERRKVEDNINKAIESYKSEDKIQLAFYRPSDIDNSLSIISLDTIPREVQYTPQNKVIAMASPGRNNPFYHYTGSEDTLEFTIDWYSNSYNKSDVIMKCREVEAMSKNDSYDKTPALLRIIWGKQDLLFNDTYWVIEKAPYKLQNFNRAYRDWDKNTGELGKDLFATGLLPVQAYQQLTLKKVTPNNSSFYQNMFSSNFEFSNLEFYNQENPNGIKIN